MEDLTVLAPRPPAALSEEELQVLGAMPFDPSRANPRALEILEDLRCRGFVQIDVESGTLRPSPAGRSAQAAINWLRPRA